MRQIILIAHNLRSTHNVGSLLRTAEGLGVERVLLTGYTPYPAMSDDQRLPHIAQKLDKQIAKTALDAQKLQAWEHYDDILEALTTLKQQGYAIVALEQTPTSLDLSTFQAPAKLAIIVGREVEGLEPELLSLCDQAIQITMFGGKESFNVVQAAAMALYHLRFT